MCHSDDAPNHRQMAAAMLSLKRMLSCTPAGCMDLDRKEDVAARCDTVICPDTDLKEDLPLPKVRK